MAVPTVISGKDVLINGVTGMQQLKLTKNVPTNTFAHAGTAGGTQTLLGVQSWSFTASGVGYEPTLFPSPTAATKSLTFYYTTPDKLSYSGDLLVSSLTITGDKANKQNPWTWQANGVFTGAVSKVATGNQDAGGYAAEGGSYVDVLVDDVALDTCLQSVSLNFTMPTSPYNYAGVAYNLGGNIAASMTMNLLENDTTGVLSTGNQSVRVAVNNAADSWDLNYILWSMVDGPSGSRDTNAAVGMTVTGNWTIDTDGGIRSPGNTVHIGAFA